AAAVLGLAVAEGRHQRVAVVGHAVAAVAGDDGEDEIPAIVVPGQLDAAIDRAALAPQRLPRLVLRRRVGQRPALDPDVPERLGAEGAEDPQRVDAFAAGHALGGRDLWRCA